MAYLLDTHVLLWSFRRTSGKLGKNTRAVLQKDSMRKYVSVVSLWEATIKNSLGKLDLQDDFFEILATLDIEILPIEIEHLEALQLLPHHHGDPFDRMLIAQAQAENLTLITADKNIPRYEVAVLLAAT
jgi:PIN domain nuclease of toxin-antitoxin system